MTIEEVLGKYLLPVIAKPDEFVLEEINESSLVPSLPLTMRPPNTLVALSPASLTFDLQGNPASRAERLHQENPPTSPAHPFSRHICR